MLITEVSSFKTQEICESLRSEWPCSTNVLPSWESTQIWDELNPLPMCFVLCCCVTNYPKMQCLKTAAFCHFSFLGVDWWAQRGGPYAGFTDGPPNCDSQTVLGLGLDSSEDGKPRWLSPLGPILGLFLSIWPPHAVFLRVVSPAELLDFSCGGSGLSVEGTTLVSEMGRVVHWGPLENSCQTIILFGCGGVLSASSYGS